MSIEKILVIDDELLMRNFIAETLKRRNLDVTVAENGTKAISLIKENSYDMVITDMKLPDITGIEVLKKVKEISPHTIVVIITAFAAVENAVEAMRLGAYNYLIKPFTPDTIEALIEKAGEHIKLLAENSYLRQQVSRTDSSNMPFIIGESDAIKKIQEDIKRIAQSNASVFIQGESGTGKEVIAQAIHSHSLRASRPFIKVNCAAIPETLIESEFFGHEKGSFTGANAKRIGRFELANTGSLLLDEVTEIPASLQAKLLRVIQEHEFERVGGNKPVKVDVRIISTSNRDMKIAIKDKQLREDLYYRLNVVPIFLPPLRERRDDIIPLAEFFIEKFCREYHKAKKSLSKESKNKLLEYPWPGNVRELGNIIERTVVMDVSKVIGPEHLVLEQAVNVLGEEKTGLPVGITLQELERRFIIETLHSQNNDRKKAAEVLGISVRTLTNKLKE